MHEIQRHLSKPPAFFVTLKLQRLSLSLLLLLTTALLLSACGSTEVKITRGHLDSLQQHFLGREFVFRTDWHAGMVVYKGKTMNNVYGTMYNDTAMVKKNRHHQGSLVARSGDVATITAFSPAYNHRLNITFKTEMGSIGYITIMAPNKDSWGSEFYEDMTDQMASVSWVEEQLCRRTIKFLDHNESLADKLPTKLPTPPTEPVLTPVSRPVSPAVAGLPAEPSVSGLQVKANPQRVRPGETLNLDLSYAIETAGRMMIEVTESRHLTFNGKALPSYPKERKESRSQGRHSSSFRQKIPSQANPGTYTYKGEVCIDAGCVSRRVRFVIEP